VLTQLTGEGARVSTAPIPSLIRETVQATRGAGARGVAAAGSGLFGTNIEIDPGLEESIRKDEQKFWGMLAPLVGAPQPEGYMLPSAVNRLIRGGGALQDFLNFMYANRATREGLPGPLTNEGTLKPVVNPLSKAFFSTQEREEKERRDTQAVLDITKQDKRIVDDFLNSLVNPTVSDVEKTRAQNRFYAHPKLMDRGFGQEALQRTFDRQTMTPTERALSNAPIATIEDILPRLLDQSDTDRMAHMTAKARDNLSRLLFIALQRMQQAEENKAGKQERGKVRGR
jgi:hypothetical protein